MIIFDLYQIFFGALIPGLHANKITIDENLFRHMILNNIRAIRKKFSDYDEIVIASDKNSWRKEYFKQYKANRRKDETYDWNQIFDVLNKITEEIKDYFPYRCVYCSGAEADDVIAVLTREFHQTKDILIVSGDKDLLQLQKYKNVKQYDPTRKKFLSEKDPVLFLEEHIIRGDSSDGIPNILSPDNSFTDGIRQKPITAKKINELKSLNLSLEPDFAKNYERNKKLIDLSYTPDNIKYEILSVYQKESQKPKTNLMNYFIQKKLTNLIESINDF